MNTSTQRARRLSRATGALLAISVALVGGARAADWEQDWKATIAQAHREGEVVVATSPNLSRRDYLLKQWAKDYPGIKISLTQVRGANFLPMVIAERRSGKFLWDVFQSGPTTALEAAERQVFDPLLPELILPEVNNPDVWGGWNDAFYDDEKKYVIGLVSDVAAPYYNASMIVPAKVQASGLQILLDPAYKGKIVWYDPRLEGPGSLFMPTLERNLGAEALRKLIVDQQPIFVNNLNAVAEAIVRRKAAIALAGSPKADMREFATAGVAPDVRSFGPGPKTAYRSTDGSALAIFNQRPHPAAARVFANWYMTREVSAGMAQATQFDSRRTDIPPLDPTAAAVPGGDYVDPQRGEGLKSLRFWRTETKRLAPQ